MAINEFTCRYVMKNILHSSPDESLGFLLSRIYSLRTAKMNEELESLGLNYVQYNLLTGLYWLQLKENKVNQKMLIEFSHLDKSVVSNILGKMVKKGIIERTEDTDDTRNKIVILTFAGQTLIEKAVIIVDNIDKAFWGNTGLDNLRGKLQEIIKING